MNPSFRRESTSSGMIQTTKLHTSWNDIKWSTSTSLDVRHQAERNSLSMSKKRPWELIQHPHLRNLPTQSGLQIVGHTISCNDKTLFCSKAWNYDSKALAASQSSEGFVEVHIRFLFWSSSEKNMRNDMLIPGHLSAPVSQKRWKNHETPYASLCPTPKLVWLGISSSSTGFQRWFQHVFWKMLQSVPIRNPIRRPKKTVKEPSCAEFASRWPRPGAVASWTNGIQLTSLRNMQ